MTTMKAISIYLIILFGCFAEASNLQAQYTVDWLSIAGGGGTIGGGGYTLDGTVGQPDVGSLAGGGYDLAGGFWVSAITAPTLFISRAGANALLSWEGGGFMVQGADEPTGAWTDLSAGTSTDGVHFGVGAAISGRMKFFRLRSAN